MDEFCVVNVMHMLEITIHVVSKKGQEHIPSHTYTVIGTALGEQKLITPSGYIVPLDEANAIHMSMWNAILESI